MHAAEVGLSQTALAFDRLAATYGATVDDAPMGREIHARTQHVLDAHLPTAGTVIDFGCGIGTDALWLASRGNHVLAIDLSPGMLAVARQRVGAAGYAEVIELRHGSIEQLRRPLEGWPPVVGALCSLGALDTLADGAGYFSALAPHLGAGATVVTSTANPWCATDALLGILAGDRARLRRRHGPMTTLQVASVPVPLYPRDLPTIEQCATPHFVLRSVEALPLLLPPRTAAALEARRGRDLHALLPIDRALASLPVLRLLGDHLLVRWERTRSPAPDLR